MLKQRIITALVLAPVVIGCVFFLPPAQFSVFVLMVLTIGAWEWANLAGLESAMRWVYTAGMGALLGASLWLPGLPVMLLAVPFWMLAAWWVVSYPANQQFWSSQTARIIIGPLLLLPPLHGLIALKASPESSFLILLLFFLIWGADIGAYFSGKAFGNRKLAPQVSPGKSWAGVYGGLLTAILIAGAMTLWAGTPDLFTPAGALFLLGCGVIVAISVLGDLTESMFKRFRGIKDSSGLLPGHGGILDRIDSLLSAAPWFALLLMLSGRVQVGL
ncbi:MAG: phosphatidate cytidylyltransferase [Pseudomonadales bacterium]|nr:phosphatidate cytidylyltransferase [Pseudomonadales bacterium]